MIAPTDARQFLSYVATRPGLHSFLRVTSPQRLADYVDRVAGQAIGRVAAEGLHARYPAMSAAPRRFSIGHRAMAAISAAAGIIGCGFVFAPFETLMTMNVTLVAVFLGWIVIRLAGMLLPTRRGERQIKLSRRALPTYSIVVALYREAASVRRLIRSLEALNYPHEKLDIVIVLEQDDRETLAALSQIRLAPQFRIITAPDIGPRTKPKALNVALPRLRGAFVAVYDAEDRPDPDQLLRAVEAFRSGPRDLACVQARLTIDNTADSWLAGLYTAEYAAQFDVFLPVLAALSAPLPLGGTSNHFRTDLLRAAGGWDSYNVTEDADLGLRLARLGYRCDVINSATYEEAPARITPWLRQRTRWFKGWMKTYVVHMREPAQLARQLGPFSFVIFQLSFGGNVLAALVHPLFLMGLVFALVNGTPNYTEHDVTLEIAAGLFGTTAAAGYIASAILNSMGLMRRGLISTLWVVVLTPVHWLLLSVAAWRALYQLARDPYKWEKTEHGLARHSRRRSRLLETLGALERELVSAQRAR